MIHPSGAACATCRRRTAVGTDGAFLFVKAEDLFTETSWVAVMTGQGLYPRGVDPIAAAQPAEEMREKLDWMRAVIRRGAKVMPTHEQFIAEHCKAHPV